MSGQPNEASFLKDVAEHEMTVFRDDGLYRHLRFSRPKTRCYCFDVTTWPGYLAFTGDMGCYVFSRIPDMLEFFRKAPGQGDRLAIDLYYWSQKVQSVDRCDGLKEYSADLFRESIRGWLDESEASPAVREAVEREVLSRADDGKHEAIRAAYYFEHDGFQFHDVGEITTDEWSPRFLWCCYALAWAVRKYDASKAPALACPE